MTHVVHLTSVHPRFDARIFVKECRSLVRAGYAVTLVAPGERDEVVDGVSIRVVRPARGRPDRMTSVVREVQRTALGLRGDLYHFHDPELLPVGMRLRRGGSIAVYDVHEDVPRDILGKDWIARPARRAVAAAYDRFERAAAAHLDAVVAAAPPIAERFAHASIPTVTVHNYPILSEFEAEPAPWAERERAVCYVGAITAIRGVAQMVDAAALAGVQLLLGGTFTERGGRELATARPGWPGVEELGHVSRDQIASVLARARAGLLLVHPRPNHLEMHLRSHKLFEYMAAGLPVIASDLPEWRRFVDAHGCGICVDPLDPRAIATAILRVVDDPEAAAAMGARGREAVHRSYDWEREAQTLLGLYSRLLGK